MSLTLAPSSSFSIFSLTLWSSYPTFANLPASAGMPPGRLINNAFNSGLSALQPAGRSCPSRNIISKKPLCHSLRLCIQSRGQISLHETSRGVETYFENAILRQLQQPHPIVRQRALQFHHLAHSSHTHSPFFLMGRIRGK